METNQNVFLSIDNYCINIGTVKICLQSKHNRTNKPDKNNCIYFKMKKLCFVVC